MRPLLRVSRAALGGVIAALAPGQIVWAQPSCPVAAGDMVRGELYHASSEGLSKVVSYKEGGSDKSFLCDDRKNAECTLREGREYQFLYKTRETGVTNSVVVVQQARITTQPSPDRVEVVLSRDQTNFACAAAQKKSYPNDEAEAKSNHVPLETYDSFHREGPPPGSPPTVLQTKFHIHYDNNLIKCDKNGNGGVYSDAPDRSPLFLLYNRADVGPREGAKNLLVTIARAAGSAVKFALRPVVIPAQAAINAITPNVPTLQADDSKPANVVQYKVYMANYEKTSGEAGCFSFRISTAPYAYRNTKYAVNEVDVTLRDLEELMLKTEADRSTAYTWRFVVNP